MEETVLGRRDVQRVSADYIDAAAFLVSTHKNSLGQLSNPRDRRLLAAARNSLSDQLLAIHTLLNERNIEFDPQYLTTPFEMCGRAFVHTLSIIERSIESHQLKRHTSVLLDCLRATRSVVVQDVLFAVAVGESGDRGVDTRSILDAHLLRSTNIYDRIEYFVRRIKVAKVLFDDALQLLELDRSAKQVETIKRTIVFEPEYKQAGIQILSFFSDVVARKYPDMNVRVSIQQTGNLVTLLVETPGGEVEKIEHELNQYGLVVAGVTPPEKYFTNATDILQLKHKLEMAQLEIRHTSQLLQGERHAFSSRIGSLENEVRFLQKFLDKTQYENEQTAATLRTLAVRQTDEVRKALDRIAMLLSSDGEIQQQKLQEEVIALATKSPTVIGVLIELFVKGSIQGAAGNYLYTALQALNKIV